MFNQEGQSVGVQINQSESQAEKLDYFLLEMEYTLKKVRLLLKKNDIEEALYYIDIALKKFAMQQDKP